MKQEKKYTISISGTCTKEDFENFLPDISQLLHDLDNENIPMEEKMLNSPDNTMSVYIKPFKIKAAGPFLGVAGNISTSIPLPRILANYSDPLSEYINKVAIPVDVFDKKKSMDDIFSGSRLGDLNLNPFNKATGPAAHPMKDAILNTDGPDFVRVVITNKGLAYSPFIFFAKVLGNNGKVLFADAFITEINAVKAAGDFCMENGYSILP